MIFCADCLIIQKKSFMIFTIRVFLAVKCTVHVHLTLLELAFSRAVMLLKINQIDACGLSPRLNVETLSFRVIVVLLF